MWGKWSNPKWPPNDRRNFVIVNNFFIKGDRNMILVSRYMFLGS